MGITKEMYEFRSDVGVVFELVGVRDVCYLV